jgi:hypothetical protein
MHGPEHKPKGAAMFAEYASAHFYLVIVEWGGKRPPTRYYKRIRAVTTKLHGWQSNDHNIWAAPRGMQALTLQEGVFMCPDKRTALTIASWAKDGGAVFVEIMTAQHYDIQRVTVDDIKKVDEFTRALTRRGRPAKPQYWTVYCIHQGQSYLSHEPRALKCPDCGSLMVRVEQGKPKYYKRPKAGSGADEIFEYWKNTRFAKGKYFLPFEVFASVANALVEAKEIEILPTPDDIPEIENEDDKRYFDLMMRKDNHKRLYDAVSAMSQSAYRIEDKIGFLDAVFTSGRFYPDEKDHNRVNAIGNIARAGIDVGPGTMLISTDKLDIYDAWPHWSSVLLQDLARSLHGTPMNL